jgi:hypothetical protein
MVGRKILIWDVPTRLLHWLLVASFAGAFVTADSERHRTTPRPAVSPSIMVWRRGQAGTAPVACGDHDTPNLVLTASFGGYADLRNVIVYLTTGVHEFGGRRHLQLPGEYNRWKLLALLAGFVEGEGDRRVLDGIAQRRLADPGADTHLLEADLGSEGRLILALALNHRQDAVGPLLAALPSGARAAIEGLSPLVAVPRLPGRLLIAHGVGDASIPFTESLRLAEASQGRATAVFVETFEHTGPQPLWPSIASRVQDGGRLLRLTDALLSAQ